MIDGWRDEILFVQIASAWFMAGLIWFVQLVHYPLMMRVGAAEWRAYERGHQQRTTWIVAPVMLIELLTAVLLVVSFAGDAAGRKPLSVSGEAIVWITSALLAVAWISTIAVQARLHGQLLGSDGMTLRRRLVRSNWIRTIAWSGRGVLLLLLLR